jgi:hypothetical protein
MQFKRGKPPETPNAPFRAALIKDERWLSAGPGFEPVRAGPRLNLTSSQDGPDEVVHQKRFSYALRGSCASVRDIAKDPKQCRRLVCESALTYARRAPKMLTKARQAYHLTCRAANNTCEAASASQGKMNTFQYGTPQGS